ncbi:UDP-N-acetylmuramate--L-alanine ligase [bacterium]|nr:UDP-N-acetylmuramate--L-alanine ligase [bacterium]
MVLTHRIKRIHFVGVGGAGVSALAKLMISMGYEVTGSDLSPSQITRQLEASGVRIFYEHNAGFVRTADLIITSTAIPEDNVEVRAAIELNKPKLTRIAFLSYLMKGKFGITVSGSHGKSSTSAMIAYIFFTAETDPTFVVGGLLNGFLGNSRLGKSKFFICEGDESNNSFLEFTANVGVVLNIDDDHIDFHKSVTNLQNSFIKFINKREPDGVTVVCLDDAGVREVLPKLQTRLITYGIDAEDVDYRAKNIRIADFTTRFDVFHKTRGEIGSVHLRFPGRHYVQNALASIAVAEYCGVGFDKAAVALETFPGVHRRFEKLIVTDDVMVIDDYAHHPTEIAALMRATRAGGAKRLRVVFQPHRYTRSKLMAKRFPEAFDYADEVILTSLYSAGERPIAGIGSRYLFRYFEERFPRSRIKLIEDSAEIVDYLRNTIRKGDVMMTVGAGDVYKIGNALKEHIENAEIDTGDFVADRTFAEFSSDEDVKS